MPAVILTSVVGLLVAAFAYRCLQQLVFHPLAKYPGPIVWRFSRIPYAFSLYHGNLVRDVLEIHARYGEVVRIAPDELSFTSPDACRDIYAKRQGRPAFQKNQTWVPTPPKNGGRTPSILNADDEDHARFRKAWAYGFSDKALKEQESIVHNNVAKLVSQLSERVKRGAGSFDVDIVRWYNYCAFDIVSDLTFGESFGCLDRDEYHEWVEAIIHHFKAAIMMTAYQYFPTVHGWMKKRMPKESFLKQAKHFQWAKEKTRHRLKAQVDRPDFVAHLAKSKEGLSDDEIETTAAILIIAGSNSLTTTLSGTTNYLVRNPDVLQKLTDELRGTFAHESEMTLQAVSQLPYLNAVIEEGLRMITPVPLGIARVVPDGGAVVDGHALPGGTSVSYQSYAATHTARNFSNPFEFQPQRWLSSEQARSGAGDRLEASQPFSMGPRSCLGRNMAYFELRLVLAQVFWAFDVGLPDGPGTGTIWTDQKTYATWDKKEFVVRLVRAAKPS